MHLRVKFNEKEYPLPNVPENCSGKEIKDIVAKVTGIDDPNRIKLICMGKVIKDDKQLTTDYKMGENALMHMVAREPDLAPPPPQAQAQPGATPAAAPGFQSGAAEGGDPSTTTAAAAAAAPDFSQMMGLLGGVFGGLGGAAGAGGGADAPGGGASASIPGGGGGAAFASFIQNLGSMAANARANGTGTAASTGSAGNTSTSYTTSGPDGSRTQRTTSSTTSSTNRTPPPPAAAPSASSATPRQPSPQTQEANFGSSTNQTPVNATAAAAPAAAAHAAPGGIHVHVHVTMDELESLPERLERFTQRVPFAQVHVEHEEQQQQQRGGAASQWFQNMRPAMERAVRNANHYAHNVGRGGSRSGSDSVNGADNGGCTTDRHNARASCGDDAEEVVVASSSSGETKQQHREISREEEEDNDESEESLLSSIGKEIKAALQMPDFMALIAGDWSSMSKVHPALHKRICGKCKSVSPTEGQLTKMTLKGCTRIRRRLEDPNHPLAKQFKEAGKPGVNLPAVIEIALQHVGFQLARLIVRTNPLQFAKQIRALIVKHTGVLYRYAKDHWFKSQQDLDAMIKAGLTHAMSSDTAQNDPTMSAMAPMLMPMVVNTIQMWTTEYERAGTFGIDVPVITTPLIAGTAGSSSSGAPRQQEADMLDSVLDDYINSAATTAGGGGSGISDALLDEVVAGLDSAEAAKLRADLRAGLESTPVVDAAGSEQVSDLYNSLYQKEL